MRNSIYLISKTEQEDEFFGISKILSRKDADNYERLASDVKQVIVRAACDEAISAWTAQWLIQILGLRAE